MKMYLSSPAYNNPQVTGHATIQEAAEEAGIELLNPNAIKTVNDDGSPALTPLELVHARLEMLESADIVLVWLDQLLTADHKLFLLTNVHEKVEIPFPPQMIQFLSIGMQATGAAQVRPKKGIVTPNDPNKGMEVTNVPKSFMLAPEGGIVAQVVEGPINLPDTNVAFEMGYARCLNKPILALGIAWPRCGILIPCSANLLITEFEGLGSTLKEIREALEKGIGEFSEAATRLQGEYQKRTRHRLEALRAQAAKEREEEEQKLEKGDTGGGSKVIVPDFGRKG